MEKTEIGIESRDPKRPYANLLPIVDMLIAHGNSFADGGFRLTQGGWECQLTMPIDFALVARSFSVPASIDASPDYDTILDRQSWCASRDPAHERHDTQPQVSLADTD
jgi:hypothetical protein